MLQRNLLKLVGVLIVTLIVLYLHMGNSEGIRAGIARNEYWTQKRMLKRASGKPSTTSSHNRLSSSLNGEMIKGVALQVNYTADGISQYLRAIDEIADLGANTIGLSTAGYQENAGSASINLDLRKCPTPEQFAKLIAKAHSRGMRVIIMPVILLSNPRGSEWRGVIQPPDWDEWFSSYLSFIKYFAKIGLDNNAYGLVVGAELISTETFRDRWITIIKQVRKIFHGKLLYSANWDHYRQVSFWDKLDLIGMTTYHKLADKENPPLETLLKSWQPIKKQILDWRKTINKPILFTEVGWCSQPGASIEAWNYYRHLAPSKAGLEEQKKCYIAFVQTWKNTPGIAGAIWWEWTISGGGPNDYGYTPKGKPALEILKKWFAGKY